MNTSLQSALNEPNPESVVSITCIAADVPLLAAATSTTLSSIVQSSDILSRFTNLRILKCTGLNITALPKLPTGLVELRCAENKLKRLPVLPATLTVLICNNNRLTSLPSVLPSSLLILYAHANQLTALPATLPPNLSELNVAHNSLTQLPALLPNTLMVLNCDYNALRTMPILPSTLIILMARENKLTSLLLPDHLVTLNVQDNKIGTIAHFPPTLVHINVAYNQLAMLPELPPQLLTLDCKNNNLTELPAPLPQSLTILDCYDNFIRRMPPLPPNLETLVIDGNDMSATYRQQVYDHYYNLAKARHERSMRRPTKLNIAPHSESYITEATAGDNPIEMENNINVRDFLLKDPRNFVVKYHNAYTLLNKDDIAANVQNNIMYKCLKVSGRLHQDIENIDRTEQYILTRSIGIVNVDGAVPMYQLKLVLDSVDVRAVEILRTSKKLPAMISHSAMMPGASLVSASHCQEGTGANVYDILEIPYDPATLVFPTRSRGATLWKSIKYGSRYLGGKRRYRRRRHTIKRKKID